jgi:hypothetical protein
VAVLPIVADIVADIINCAIGLDDVPQPNFVSRENALFSSCLRADWEVLFGFKRDRFDIVIDLILNIK